MEERIDGKIRDFAYLMAFRDATSRRAFVKKDNESDKDFHERKQNAFDGLRKKADEYIFELMSNKKPNPVDYIINICETNADFTFGNAQKLINMYAKYMYMSAYGDSGKSLYFDKCDCPMDSKMIEKLGELCDEYNGENVYWSRLLFENNTVPEEYMNFQKKVRECCEKEKVLPIEFDFLHWDE